MPVRPGPRAFAAAGDRLLEKRLFRHLGIPTAPFAAVDSLEGLRAAIEAIGLPAVLKVRREGYDGKGQRVLRRADDAAEAWRALGERPAILEGFVPFSRELSILAVRGVSGEVRFWSPVENHHEAGILRHSRPLAPGEAGALESAGRRIAASLLDALDYVGVLTVELFEVEGRLVANEIACRVHNSGHWTEEGAEISQFENHLRAIAGWSLGRTHLLGPTALVNVIGEPAHAQPWLAVPGARVHLYGKRAAPGRKLGHVTVRADSREALRRALARGAGESASASPAPDAPWRRAS